MKVDIKEVESYIRLNNQSLLNLNLALADMKDAVKGFINESELKGSFISFQQEYYKSVHLEIIEGFRKLIAALKEEETYLLGQFEDMVDSLDTAYINTVKLDEKKISLEGFQGKVYQLDSDVSEIRREFTSLGVESMLGIGTAPIPKDSEINSLYKELTDIIDKTETSLHSFEKKGKSKLKDGKFEEEYGIIKRKLKKVSPIYKTKEVTVDAKVKKQVINIEEYRYRMLHPNVEQYVAEAEEMRKEFGENMYEKNIPVLSDLAKGFSGTEEGKSSVCSFIGSIIGGMYDGAIWDTVSGLVVYADHVRKKPLETLAATLKGAVRIDKLLKNELDAFVDEMVQGSAEDRGHYIGKAGVFAAMLCYGAAEAGAQGSVKLESEEVMEKIGRNGFGSSKEVLEGAEGSEIVVESGSKTGLLDELASSGVKYNPDEVVTVVKNSDGNLMWLEKGNSKAGLTHILERHADDFASQGVDDISKLLQDVLSTNPIKTGSNAKGLFADYVLNDNSYRIAYGTNGFIVSFYPID